AADKAAIDDSIKRAQTYLKNQLDPRVVNRAEPVADVKAYAEAPAALAGVALLLSGERRDDPAVQEIARRVRAAAIDQGSTYHLALDLIFLDHLGEQADGILIQSMSARLIWGQSVSGGWDYRCPLLTDVERARVAALVREAQKNGGSADGSRQPKLDDG